MHSLDLSSSWSPFGLSSELTTGGAFWMVNERVSFGTTSPCPISGNCAKALPGAIKARARNQCARVRFEIMLMIDCEASS